MTLSNKEMIFSSLSATLSLKASPSLMMKKTTLSELPGMVRNSSLNKNLLIISTASLKSTVLIPLEAPNVPVGADTSLLDLAPCSTKPLFHSLSNF